MRSGELLALTLRDFDFEARTVTIDKNYARLDKEDLILDPKTPKSNRTIGLPGLVCDMVKEYASRLVDYKDGDRLFDVTKHFLYHESLASYAVCGHTLLIPSAKCPYTVFPNHISTEKKLFFRLRCDRSLL